MIRKKLDKKN